MTVLFSCVPRLADSAHAHAHRNLYQYLSLQGANVSVYRSQEIEVDELVAKHPNITHLVLSPGPGHPATDSGISIPALKHFAGKVPVLGVCLGLQCIFMAYGGTVGGAGEIIHGKTSQVVHDGKGLFHATPQYPRSTRYHSLVGMLDTLPDELEVTARTREGVAGEQGGVVMAIRHKTHCIEAVQYHPESILSDEGQTLLKNFLSCKGGSWADNPHLNTTSSNTTSTQRPLNQSGVATILEKIAAQRTLDIASAKATPGAKPHDLDRLLQLHAAPPAVNLHARLQNNPAAVALMAEVKRASPSKGDIVPPDAELSAAAVGLSYATAGASVISVLTEPKWFKGSLQDMRSVRQVVDALPNRPAVLRKDFILDPYQIDEARLYGADTVLLIVAMLDDAILKRLYDHAQFRGMEPLVEVNNADELQRALAIGSKVIGVNNRNLHDFNVDMQTSSRIAELMTQHKDVVLCALSGISKRQDVQEYQKQGIRAVLVGEALMRAQDRARFVAELLGTGLDGSPAASTSNNVPTDELGPKVKSSPPDGISSDHVDQGISAPADLPASTSTSLQPPSPPLVKICGIKTPEQATAAANAGADLLGLMFVPKSKRYISLDAARAIVATVRSRPAASSSSSSSSQAVAKDWFSFQTRRLSQRTRKPLLVGVFQDQPLEEVVRLADELQLDTVQLHGNEPFEWCRLLSVPVIKVFHVDADATAAQSLPVEASRPGYHAVPLLDTKVGAGPSGGAGQTFDWSIAKRVSDDARRTQEGLPKLPIVLAGGLTPENVAGACEQVRPWAVDVSGGVETDGQKDALKIKAFIEAVKTA